jgi:cytochrome c peroxidase
VACKFVALSVLLALALTARAEDVTMPVPEGVMAPEVPADNPLTAAKVELGKKLYFDTRLSSDDSISCATCHDPRAGFAEHKPVSDGVADGKGVRNAPTVMNAAFFREQFWDGRAPTLEAQAVLPIINPVEMAMADHPVVEKKLAGIAEYGPLFKAAFGDEKVTITRVGQALASFERTLLSLDAPIDRFRPVTPRRSRFRARLGALQRRARDHRARLGVALHRRSTNSVAAKPSTSNRWRANRALKSCRSPRPS